MSDPTDPEPVNPEPNPEPSPPDPQPVRPVLVNVDWQLAGHVLAYKVRQWAGRLDAWVRSKGY